MREHVCRHLRPRRGARQRHPERDRPDRPAARRRPRRRCARNFAAPDEKLVLLVGRLVYEKGFQLALDALAADRSSDVGERALPRRRLRHPRGGAEGARPSELGLIEHGTFLGWIGDDVLHSLYRIADLMRGAPSLYEPFGLVALEAMASGCPCIVADTGGLREVVPAGRARRPALQRRRRRAPRRDDRADADRRRAARPPRRRGLRARAALRLGRRRPPDGRRLRRGDRRRSRAVPEALTNAEERAFCGLERQAEMVAGASSARSSCSSRPWSASRPPRRRSTPSAG